MSGLKVLITGSTGMVGKGVLIECLDSKEVASVLLINRHSTGIVHRKLTEVIHSDFSDLSSIEDKLTNLDACFYCMGVSAVGMAKVKYFDITYRITLSLAHILKKHNDNLCFCYVSGAGTSTTEDSRMDWANVKGKTENDLAKLFKCCYLFRPGFIQPMRGIKSATPLYNGIYKIVGPMFPVIKKVFPKQVTTTELVGRAMIKVIQSGYTIKHLTNQDINILATT